MPTYEQLTYNSDDGAQLGVSSTTPLAFYGATPIVRPTMSSATVSSVSSQSTSSGAGIGFGFPSLAEYQNAVNAISTMQYGLRQLGLLA